MLTPHISLLALQTQLLALQLSESESVTAESLMADSTISTTGGRKIGAAIVRQVSRIVGRIDPALAAEVEPVATAALLQVVFDLVEMRSLLKPQSDAADVPASLLRQMQVVGDLLAAKLQMFIKKQPPRLVQASSLKFSSLGETSTAIDRARQLFDRLDQVNLEVLLDILASPDIELNTNKILDEIFQY